MRHDARKPEAEPGPPPLAWRLSFALLRTLARLPWRWQMRLAWTLAPLLASLAGKRRRIAAVNLALCFPELDPAARERLLKANLRSTVVGLFETAMAWFAPALPPDLVEVEGLEHLQAALAKGRGALCLSGHFHTLELQGRLLSQALGRAMPQMVRRHNDPRIEAVIDAARRRYCERTVEKKQIGTLLRVLRDGHPFGYAPDQDFNLHTAFVPFFGQPAATLSVTSRIARLSGAPVLCFWLQRKAQGYGYRLCIEPPLENFPGPDPVADTARIAAQLESAVRRCPEQYLWVHRRFKTRPPGAADAYPAELLKERHRHEGTRARGHEGT